MLSIGADLASQARKNAAWWRREIAAGRVAVSADTVDWLLRDLETAGGGARPEKG